MIAVEFCLILGFLSISVAINFLERGVVRKMDELIKLVDVLASDAWSGALEISEAIKADKTVKIPEQVLNVLESQAKQILSSGPVGTEQEIYRAGLKDGSIELAKYILEQLKETE